MAYNSFRWPNMTCLSSKYLGLWIPSRQLSCWLVVLFSRVCVNNLCSEYLFLRELQFFFFVRLEFWPLCPRKIALTVVWKKNTPNLLNGFRTTLTACNDHNFSYLGEGLLTWVWVRRHFAPILVQQNPCTCMTIVVSDHCMNLPVFDSVADPAVSGVGVCEAMGASVWYAVHVAPGQHGGRERVRAQCAAYPPRSHRRADPARHQRRLDLQPVSTDARKPSWNRPRCFQESSSMVSNTETWNQSGHKEQKCHSYNQGKLAN